MMELPIRQLYYDERKYTYAQSQQLRGQTGSIGHLRGDFGSGGQEFYTSWDEHNSRLKTPEFSSELDEVINALRSEEYGLLKSRPGMAQFARKYPDSAFKGSYTTEHGFRVDTEKHAYLIRCNPTKGDYNFYCFCYVKEWLDRHMDKAGQDIRFIDSHYKELFRLPDGEQVVITLSNGETMEQPCRYIDETHLEVGNNLYHICEFAERMERGGNTYAPKETPLPRECLSVLADTGELVKIDRYRMGCMPISVQKTPEENRETASRYNEHYGVSKAQEAAMLAGSMSGWDTPLAKPKSYDENGVPIKPKNKNKEYER